VGGIELGLKPHGVRTVAYVEFDHYAQAVLLSRMADGGLDRAPLWPDVRTFDGHPWRGRVDLIHGGFPCQDLSVAGKRAGITGARSGLWSEFARIIGEVRPRFVFVENVPGLLANAALGRVLGDLAALGFNARWEGISASAVGAPHIRDRVWLLAYTQQELGSDLRTRRVNLHEKGNDGTSAEWRKDWELAPMVPGIHPRKAADWWLSQSRVARTADGLPGQLERCGAIGNAVVPQCAEEAFRVLMREIHAPASPASEPGGKGERE
jgi:DNA (cytosine-5)-methyltransferase 1